MRKFINNFVGGLLMATIIGVIIALTIMLTTYLSNGNMLIQISLSILFAIILANIAYEIYTLYNKRIEKRSQAKMTYKCSLNEFIEDKYKAKNVRNVINNNIKIKYERLLEFILIKAEEGEDRVMLKYVFGEYDPIMKKPLEELGYTVEEKSDEVIISWN